MKRLPSFSKTPKNADFIAERRSLEKVKEVKEATDITSVLHRRLIFYLFSIIATSKSWKLGRNYGI